MHSLKKPGALSGALLGRLIGRDDPKRNGFDGLRLLFALMVVVAHSTSLLVHDNDKNEWLLRLTGYQLYSGSIAVYGCPWIEARRHGDDGIVPLSSGARRKCSRI